MEDYGKRLPVSTRQVRMIMQSPQAMAAQGGRFMSEWGGGERYMQMAKMPMESRVVYYALQAGLAEDQIPVATGLTQKETNKGLSVLREKGLYETAEAI